MASALYFGQVMHQRFRPVAYQFKYGVFSIKVDIDTIEAESAKLTWLSINKFNLFSLNYADYGARKKDEPWRVWANQLLAEYGITRPAHRIELVCFPRYLGLTFNPLAMWYAYNKQNQLIAVICEVSNTFGQWHHYVLTHQGKPLADKPKACALKVFHVSPFMNMQAHYEFRFAKPAERYQISIFQKEEGKPLLTSTQVGKHQPLTSSNLVKAAMQYPFNTLKVVWMIHWWALKIWIKGGKFHKTPKHLESVNYSHTEMTSC
ncbi:DUF1365 domain-containing protein [Thiomicrorhabdus sp. Kp2]|uniref:DUF1365 domain-containing protein n=1 Tax=Thiomicrorhabdus sp. Kp2 TaxID=1123518 RepID=UPI0004206C22|nr:DUF1365 domain-containing protein [Thiomicrorhabdus sp. Kp2]